MLTVFSPYSFFLVALLIIPNSLFTSLSPIFNPKLECMALVEGLSLICLCIFWQHKNSSIFLLGPLDNLISKMKQFWPFQLPSGLWPSLNGTLPSEWLQDLICSFIIVSDDRLLLREGEQGVKGDPSPGSALTDQETILQHPSMGGRDKQMLQSTALSPGWVMSQVQALST